MFLRLTEEIVDEYLGVDFFLNIEQRGVNDEVGPVLFVFAAPYELRIQISRS